MRRANYFDKTAKLLEPHPGGPWIDRIGGGEFLNVLISRPLIHRG